jgi:hypothetical protein
LELSTFPAAPSDNGTGEAAPLYGALGDRLGAVQLGVDVRPSYLHVAVPGFTDARRILMNADLLGAYQANDWIFYGEVGRRPTDLGGGVYSYEYWAGREPSQGLGFRVGRFMPAYGIRFADHTSFNRSFLGFDRYDQVLGLEVSYTTNRALTQVSVSPGKADAVFDANGQTGQRRLTLTGREQFDLTPRTSLVVSGLFRDATTLDPRMGAFGLAGGYAPIARISTWTSLDVDMQSGGRTSYIFVNETAVEAVRGLWLKVSPQIRTDPTGPYPGLFRLVLDADFLPRTHWNVEVSYYRDRDRRFEVTTSTVLTQLHLYL